MNLDIINNSIALGEGLRVDNQGFLALDKKFSSIWTGTHQFTRPILFSEQQSFSTSNLFSEGEKHGQVLTFVKGQGWRGAGENPLPGAIFMWQSGSPSWSKMDLSHSVQNVLPIKNGGTGISDWEPGELFVAGKKMSPGQKGDILSIDDRGEVTWGKSKYLSGRGDYGSMAIWNSDNTLTNFPLFAHPDGSLATDGDILIKEAVLRVQEGALKFQINQAHWVLENKCISATTEGKTWFKFSAESGLEIGTISVAAISGVLSADKGGTGQRKLKRGDMLYAQNEREWGRIGVPEDSHGMVLSLVDGMPVWANPHNSAANPRTTLKLAAGKASRAPLVFSTGILTHVPQMGALEWEGDDLFFTPGSTRKRIVFQDENITGTAKQVREVVPLSLGGLGMNGNSLPDYSLLFKTGESISPINPGPDGSYLSCHIVNGIPTYKWQNILQSIQSPADGGLYAEGDHAIKISLNYNANADWKGIHRFRKSVQLDEGAFVGALVLRPIVAPPAPKNGLLWFDGSQLWLTANGKPQSLLGSASTGNPHKITHYFSIGVTRRARVPMPYLGDGVTQAKWKAQRLSIRAEELVSELKLQLMSDDGSELSETIMLSAAKDSAQIIDFINPHLFSGQEVWLEIIGDAAESIYISAWLLIQEV